MNNSVLDKNAGTVLCSVLLEMCLQSLKLIAWAVFVLELVKCSPPRNNSVAKFFLPWKLQHPSKHLLVFRTSWIRLQHVFSLTILRLPRRLEEVLKTSWRRLAKTSSIRLGRQKIVMLKTSSRPLEDMSWRLLEGISWRRLQDVSEANKIFTGYL